MEADFWLQRWREGRTGFHRSAVMPLLLKHWSAIGVPRGARVFVPLCGKTLDMPWFAQQGLRVLGADLSPPAIEQFLAENHLRAASTAEADGVHYRVEADAGNADIELILGDVFDIAAETLASCGAVYDRAAMIALPPAMRERYVREVYGKLPRGCRGLLITLEYPQAEKSGPPFSVEEPEVRRLFGTQWDVELLERRDILADQPSFSDEGVTALSTAVYRLQRQ
jgi:thiopurine S-methyltransferase